MNADNMVGRTVAGYHLAEYIGEGGTATVYRAETTERGRAAVKILRPRLAQDPIAVKRFLREAEYGARVKHPNIVQTYDYGATDGLHYLALEWAQGEPLAEFINRSGKLAPALVATIVEQLGAALGITFQQIQKYERGANRIGASRLFDICRILDVAPQFFFEAMPTNGEAAPSGALPPATRSDDVIDRETMDLVRAYRRIESPSVRHRLLELARALAKAE